MKWAATRYPISYNNVFDADISDLPDTYTIEQEIRPTPISRKGYDFQKWTPSSIPIGQTEKRVFTASWLPKSYQINYELNGGSLADKETSYTIESNDYIPSVPSKVGYEFKSWSPESIPHGSVGDKTFTANWGVKQYEIEYVNTYDANISSLPKNYTIEQAIAPNAISRSGWKFNGWNPASIAQGSTGNKKFSASWTALPVGYSIPDRGEFYIKSFYPIGSGETKTGVKPSTTPAGSIPSGRIVFNSKVAITATVVNGKAQLKIENTYNGSNGSIAPANPSDCIYRATVVVTYGRGTGTYTVSKTIAVSYGSPITVTI